MKGGLLFGCLLWLPLLGAAERYPLENPAQSQQFERLSHEIRCLVCQNQSLAESSAPFAQDLKEEIYRAVQGGQSDTIIKGTLVARYGEAILFEPPWDPHYYALWLAPGVLLLLMLFGLYRYLRLHWRAS